MSGVSPLEVETLLESTLPDSHCHIHPQHLGMQGRLHEQHHPRDSTKFNLVCATDPSVDWGTIEALLLNERGRTERSLLGGFGIHPWWALQSSCTHEETIQRQEQALNRLEAMLHAFPEAAVAEIGIDTLRTSPSTTCCGAASHSGDVPALELSATEALSLQSSLFEQQMTLAAKLNRPASIHVVGKGSYGYIDSYLTAIHTHNHALLKQYKKSRTVGGSYRLLPPAVIFHGFCGSVDFVKKLLKMFPVRMHTPEAVPTATLSPPAAPPTPQLFFGVSPNTTLRLKKVRDLIGDAFAEGGCGTGVIPPDCLLIESDEHYLLSASESGMPSLPQARRVDVLGGVLDLYRIMSSPTYEGDAPMSSTVVRQCSLRLRNNANRAFASIIHR